MKLPFGLQLTKKPADQPRDRITAPSATDFGWYGTKLSPLQVRSLLNGMRAGSFVDGYELFSEMQDTWHTLAKNLQQLREAVASVRYQVNPATPEGEDASESALDKAATCRAALQSFLPDPVADENNFEDFIYDLTDALVLGVNVQEILWAKSNGLILPRATCWVHPTQYALGNDGRLGLNAGATHSSLLARHSSAAPVSPFTPDKFIVAAYKTRSGARTVGGLLRPLAWFWCARQFGLDWVLRNAELFGQPIRDIEYDNNIKPEDLAELKLMAANMGSSAWITRPAGTKLTLVEAQKTGDRSPQAELLDRADRACDLMILWQTLTSNVGASGGGSLALGEVHLGVLEARKQNIAKWVANVISYQLFPSICRVNYGDDDECPVLKPDNTKPEDAKAKAERLQIVRNIIPLPKAWTYEQLGVPMPAEGDEVVEKGEENVYPQIALDKFLIESGAKVRLGDLAQRYDRTVGNPGKPAVVPVDGQPAPAALRARRALRASDATPPTESKSTSTSRELFAAAMAADLAPVRSRIETILALENDAALKAELAALQADLPKLLPKNSAAAASLEKLIGTAMLESLTEKP
jgi:phage gp29-like protein